MESAKIRQYNGKLGHERMTIRTFKYRQDMHAFLNKGANGCTWKEYDGPLSSGTYAFVGGTWANVKKIDSEMLAHV